MAPPKTHLSRHLALVLATAAALTVGGRSSGSPVDPNEEPPLELVVHLDGAAINAKLGKPFSVKIGDKQVEMKLTARPTKHFSFSGVEFDYPKHMSFEAEKGDPNVKTWSLDGNDAIITVHRFAKTDKDALLRSVVGATSEQLEGLEIEQTETTLTLGGRELQGARLSFALSDMAFRQDYVAFDTAESTFIFMVQDTLGDDGEPSAECRRVREKLTTTFKFPR